MLVEFVWTFGFQLFLENMWVWKIEEQIKGLLRESLDEKEGYGGRELGLIFSLTLTIRNCCEVEILN